MAEDESQTKEAPEISQEEKEPLQPGQHRSKDWKIIKIKTKEQAEAERLFNQYCYPNTWFWQYREWKQAALNILSLEIIEENTLKGHAGHKKTYPVYLGDLIFDLVKKHFDYDVDLLTLFHRLEGPLWEDIVNEFDDHFRFVAAILRQAGFLDSKIQKTKREWREKIYARAVEGKISPHWRELIMDEMFPGRGYGPKKIGHEFVDILLRYVPQAPTGRIIHWVNIILTSLGRSTVSKSSLYDYIPKGRQRMSQLTPVSITE